MATLLTIAELLAGETLISPGGPIDRLTAAAGDDLLIWQHPPEAPGPTNVGLASKAPEETLVTV